ncbi:MAG: T9SS-dependent M36 family metallopeptidase [Saprospiraceae bacterium]|nr:T9SS-dependent M36 family metallopeptidase [Saprospiraceae bacterium]
MKKTILFLLFSMSSFLTFAQNPEQFIRQYLDEHRRELNLSATDIKDWTVTDQHTSRQSGATYVYIRQQFQGIPVFNGLANFALKNGKVVSMGNRLISGLNEKAGYALPSIDPKEAIAAAAEQLNLPSPTNLRLLEPVSTHEFIYDKGNISKENIPVELMYYALSEKEVRLAWNLSIYTLDANHWWSVRIDAQTGALLDKNDWVAHCDVDHTVFTHEHTTRKKASVQKEHNSAATFAPDSYNIFPLPLESPGHGDRSIVTNPADPIASPLGWHDTDGIPGAEFTTTRGNNVFAYEDTGDNDDPALGFSPDGGPMLEFNFDYNNADDPLNYQPAAITNLFYMNNMMHDIWYHYGFDEASGNFQLSNYGHEGNGGDYVQAEAQDGSGTNNANFGTPPDGQNPRMQMYLWYGGLGDFLVINSPAGIAGTYQASGAGFGPGLPETPITADIVLMEDDVDPISNGCETIVNGNALSGKIALVDRGDCNFTVKVLSAQNQGALAVIVINNNDGNPTTMGGTDNEITIPSIMVYKVDGESFKAELANGAINGSISNAGFDEIIQDADFDNGIIAHEYGHGISNRLTGGGSNTGCLSNDEQMGEGWSDWFAIMLTIEPGDLGTDARGMGTWSNGEPITGNGIRPAPYSTDFEVNPFTYGDSNNENQISLPHGVGFIFATALWDLTWALIDEYGGTPDPDVYHGTGGNNIAMQLVIEALKIQPCNPGMIDGRDAILEADQLLYEGAHQCLIWEVFAKRGFGYSASQGSTNSRTDQNEAFDLPPLCFVATEAPVAAFTPGSLNSCNKTVDFSDNSYEIVHSWLWNFGDGTSTNIQNPIHTFPGSGIYAVQLVVNNNIGSDTTTQDIIIEQPPVAQVENVEVCLGDDAYVFPVLTGHPQWRDAENNIISGEESLIVPDVTSTRTFYVENLEGGPSFEAGALNPNFGSGGYHVSGYHGALNFTAEQPFEIVSVWVDAQGAGPRTFSLANGFNNDGSFPSASNTVAEVTVDLVNGPQVVYLNMMVPEAGDYNIGGHNVNLYRNNSGPSFPYVLQDYLTIHSSSANTGPLDYYYYFYDIVVREPQCISEPVMFTVSPVVSAFDYVDDGNGTVTFTDASTGATSWLWDFGDGNASTEDSPVHLYEFPGNYVVTLTINDGACTSTQDFTFVVGVEDILSDVPAITLQPNPASSSARVVLGKPLTEDLHLQLTNISGRVLFETTLFSGQTFTTLDIEKLPASVYFVRIKGSHLSELRKLMIER